jgi:hypothetical protein
MRKAIFFFCTALLGTSLLAAHPTPANAQPTALDLLKRSDGLTKVEYGGRGGYYREDNEYEETDSENEDAAESRDEPPPPPPSSDYNDSSSLSHYSDYTVTPKRSHRRRCSKTGVYPSCERKRRYRSAYHHKKRPWYHYVPSRPKHRYNHGPIRLDPGWSNGGQPKFRGDRFTGPFCQDCIEKCHNGKCPQNCWGWKQYCKRHYGFE